MEKRKVMKDGNFIGTMEYMYLISTRDILNQWFRTALTGLRID